MGQVSILPIIKENKAQRTDIKPRNSTEPKMTNHAKKRKTRRKKKPTIRLATWNITSFNNKDQEIIEELINKNIDICAIQETKKKGKGQRDYNQYILAYSGVKKEERARAGVGILVHKKFKDNISNCRYVSERIIHMNITMDYQKLNVISIYSPEDCKPKKEREAFYEQLQTILDDIPHEEHLILMGDFNARIGNEIVPGVKQRFNENHVNSNGELMANLCAFNELRINNTFFDHKLQYKYTFENSRGHKSMIDFIVTNRKIHPEQILDIRTLNSADAGSEHKLVLAKIRMKLTPKHFPQEITEEKFNVESLWNDSTKEMYQRRLAQKIQLKQIDDIEDINASWEKIKNNIEEAATEALGKRKVILNKRNNNNTPWFRKEIKDKCKEKRDAYMKYKTSNTPESRDTYRRIRNETKQLVRRTKNEHWEQFTKRMESDFYGTQKQIWRFIRNQRKEMAELKEYNNIPANEWERYLTELFKGKENHNQNNNLPELRHEIEISFQEVGVAINSLKNRKSPGPDGITNELLKYGGESITLEMTKLIQKLILHCKIPDAWRNSIMIPMFKKGDKEDPNNYRGINLLNTALKLTTKVLTNKINKLTTLSDEQQGFRSGRSCVDAVFVLRQITEKAIEYNKPAYLCFIDLTKAFDRIQVEDVLHLLYGRNIPINIIQTIENIYFHNRIQAKINGKLTQFIPVQSGVRQGDSLSPLLFNIIMDEIIEAVRKGRGYRMGNKEIKVLCYADDAALIAETEDDLQRLTHIFNTTAKKYNMIISAEKTKCMTTSKYPLRCKIEIDGKIIKQEARFRYLGIDITSYGDVEEEVRQQSLKASKAAGSLNDTIWKNKHLRQDTKARIYKAAIRPILTYTAETRPDTSKTRRLLETTEMKILRRISGKSLLDRERSENIRRSCNIEDINGWVTKRKQEWNEHISRMAEDRIVRIARDKSPNGRRSIGRPRKRWCDNLNNLGG